MGAGTGFGMTLKAERWPVGQLDPLQAVVEERAVDWADIARQAGLVHRKAVILTGDKHASRGQFLHRMIGAMVTEFHLHRLGAGRKTQQLVPRRMPNSGIRFSRKVLMARTA